MMLSFPAPVLSVTIDAVKDLDSDALGALWTLFTKCKESVKDGRRLENISWRLWHREMSSGSNTGPSQSFSPGSEEEIVHFTGSLTPSNTSSRDTSRGSATSIASSANSCRLPLSENRSGSAVSMSHISDHSDTLRRRPSVGQTIVEMLPNDFIPRPVASQSSRNKTSEDADAAITPNAADHPSTPTTPLHSASPTNPRVVVVKPTPQVTPHPSPPPTPITTSMGSHSSLFSVKSSDLITVPSTIYESPTDAGAAQFGGRGQHSEEGIIVASVSPEVREGSSGGSSQHGPSPDSDHLTISRRKTKEVSKMSLGRKRAGPTTVRPQANRRRSSGPDTSVHAAKAVVSKVAPLKTVVDAPKRSREPVPSVSATQTSENQADSNDHVSKAGPSTLKSSQTLMKLSHALPSPVSRKAVLPPQVFDDDDDDSDFLSTDMGEGEEWEDTESSAVQLSAQDREELRRRERMEARLRAEAEAEEARRQLFKKLPSRSYSNLARTKSGLLTALLNPDPSIFPLDHPYRATASSSDIARYTQNALHQEAHPQHLRRSSDFSRPMLQMTKSVAVLPPQAAHEHVSVSSRPKRPASRKPQGVETDDESDDPENTIQLSRSVAHEKLAALYGRKTSQNRTSAHAITQPPHLLQGSISFGRPPQITPVRTMTSPTPIPVDHPWNLPAAQAPSTPRTTRRRMLSQELTESLRRNMLWERQISKPPIVRRNSGSTVLNGGVLRPLTVLPPAVDTGPPDPEALAKSEEERKRRKRIARNRSWADDYNYSGW